MENIERRKYWAMSVDDVKVSELDAADLDFPDDPNAEPDDAPVRPIDKSTLPLFGE